MPINATHEYFDAEEKYYKAQNDEERLKALEEMLRKAPTHKGSEKFRGDIRLKIKKLKLELAKSKKKKGKKPGIKKEQFQAVLIGLTNSGKSSILKALTNAQPKIASYGFTTQEPELGTLNYQGCNIQIIDLPPIASENFNKGLLNSADTLLIVVEKIHEINSVLDSIKNINQFKESGRNTIGSGGRNTIGSGGRDKNLKETRKIIIFNKSDLHNSETIRKITETLKSKKHNFVLTSTFTKQGIEDLKEKILNSFNFIRVYTKHQGKKQKNSDKPVTIPPNSTLEDVAEKILHGFSKKVKYAKVSGPSSKFLNQKVGLKHILKDKDTVEFFTA